MAGGIASGASAHVLAPNEPCSVLSAKAAGQKFCLKADAGPSQVQLTWNPSAPGVTVYEGNARGNGQPAEVSNITDKSAVVTHLKNDTTYYFWLGVGKIVMSEIVPATPTEQVTVPGAPAGLAATADDGRVSLSWDAPVPNGGPEVSGYKVYVATSADFKGAKVRGVIRPAFVLATLQLGLSIVFDVNALLLRISRGKLVGVRSGRCDITATLAVQGTDLLVRRAHLELPGVISLRRGIRLLPIDEYPAGEDPPGEYPDSEPWDAADPGSGQQVSEYPAERDDPPTPWWQGTG